MKITVITGAERESVLGGFSENVAARMRGKKTEVKVWHAPFGINGFCDRCMTCVREGEGKCRYSREFMPVWKSMTTADLIIFLTPVYMGGLSAALKNLFEHLHFASLEHRPDPNMFGVRMLVLQAGKGDLPAKEIAESAAKWGVSKINSFRIPESPDGSDIPAVVKIAERLLAKKEKRSFSARSAFIAARKRVSAYPDDSADKKYWREKGWLGGVNPWKDICLRVDEGKDD